MFISNPGHMTKMAAMPKYCKNPLKNLLWDTWTDFNETLHVALGTGELQCNYKSWTLDLLDLFYGKVNIGRPCI